MNFNLNGTALRDALSARIKQNTTTLVYTSSSTFDTWDALKMCDENPDNSSEVLLTYGWEAGSDDDITKDRSRAKNNNGGNAGQWNRKHVFQRSLAVPALTVDQPGPGTDLHNLRPCDVQRNKLRGNLKFIAGTGNSTITNGGWYPGDEWKGDVARMVMYMYLRYNGNGSSVAQTRFLPKATTTGTLNAIDPNMVNLLLEWNAEDPPSAVELQRNPVSEQYQGNRNPFIDNPAIATAIWGGPQALDTWGIFSEPPPFTMGVSYVNNGVILSWTPFANTIGCEVSGGPANAPNDLISEIVQGFEASQIFVPQALLVPGRNYKWRVRCAEGINPFTGVTPYTPYHVLT